MAALSARELKADGVLPTFSERLAKAEGAPLEASLRAELPRLPVEALLMFAELPVLPRTLGLPLVLEPPPVSILLLEAPTVLARLLVAEPALLVTPDQARLAASPTAPAASPAVR